MAAVVMVVGVLCVAGLDLPLVAVTHGQSAFPSVVIEAAAKRSAALAAGELVAAAAWAAESSTRCMYAGAIGDDVVAVGATTGSGGAPGPRALTHVVSCPLSRDAVPPGTCLTVADFSLFVASRLGGSLPTVFCSLDALAGTELYDVAAVAVASVVKLTSRGLLSPLTVLDAQPDPEPLRDKWPELLSLQDAGTTALRRRLSDPVAASYGWARPIMAGSASAINLASWVASMDTPSRPPYSDVPESLRRVGRLTRFASGPLVDVPFSRIHVTASEPLDPPPPQVTNLQPQSAADILLPLSLLLVDAWFELQARNLGVLRDSGPGAYQEDRNVLVLNDLTWAPLNAHAVADFGPHAVLMPDDAPVPLQWTRFDIPDGTLVIGQEGFQPEARGIVWDLRGLRDGGVIVPVDFRQPAESDLNSEYIAELEASGWWPDGELFSHLRWGAMFKATVPLDIVLGPHMVSLGAAQDSFASVDRELIRLTMAHYHQVHFAPPFLPIRAVPQGSTERKYEPDRRRRTSNHSFPHFTGSIIDALGLRRVVRSLNSLVGLRDRREGSDCACERRRGRWCDSCAKWAREVKPHIHDKALDDAILGQAAAAWGELTYYAVFDFADWFSQTPTAHSERWKSTVAWRADGWPEGWRPRDVAGAPADAAYAVVEERRLGFGCAASSGICQRFTDLLMGEARRRFDAEEVGVLAVETCPKRLAWLARRRALGPGQDRLYAVHGYTDDISFSAVGADRLLRLLRTWDEVCRDFGVKVAIPAKQQVGLSVTWLGVQFFSVGGFMVLPPSKRLRILGLIADMLVDGVLAFTRYRSMVGMMESARVVVGMPIQSLYGLYSGDFSLGCLSPSRSQMRLTPQVEDLLRDWRSHLVASAGALFTAALPAALPPPASQASFFLYSDAAGEGDAPGLGGYSHGAYWYMALSPRALRLPIAVLEFVGIAVNVMTFAMRVAGSDVALYSDSLTSVQVMANRAKSDMTMFVHRAILALPELAALAQLGSLSINHVYGEGNVMADAVSRQYMGLLRELAAQMGVSLEEVEVPARAWAFLDDVVAEFERLNPLV